MGFKRGQLDATKSGLDVIFYVTGVLRER